MAGKNEIVLEEIVLLESNIDHLTGEEAGAALSALNDSPAVLDAAWFSGVGKKNRPCGLLRALCRPEDEAAVLAIFFRHTHTLGIRRASMQRHVLKRGPAEMPGSGLAAKAYWVEGEEYLRPEADAIIEQARKDNVGAPALRIAKSGSHE